MTINNKTIQKKKKNTIQFNNNKNNNKKKINYVVYAQKINNKLFYNVM